MTNVIIPDGKSWLITLSDCEIFITETWPELKRRTVFSNPVDDGFWDVTPYPTHLEFTFGDSDKALLFKLAMGGSQ